MERDIILEPIEIKLKQNGLDYTVLVGKDKLEILVKCNNNFDIECAGNCINSVLQDVYRRTGILYANSDLVVNRIYKAKIFKYDK